MNTELELDIQATQFLEERGFNAKGEPYEKPSPKVETKEKSRALGTRKNTPKEIEFMDWISGSFATRAVHFDELSFSIDIDFKKNTLFFDTTYFEWRLYNLIVQWYLADGYGICHYQFIPKKGVHFALYKLLEEEMEEYKENYFRVCEGRLMTREGLKETRRLYGIGEGPKYELVPGKRYVKHTKKITEAKRKTLEKMFVKYQKDVRKFIKQD